MIMMVIIMHVAEQLQMHVAEQLHKHVAEQLLLQFLALLDPDDWIACSGGSKQISLKTAIGGAAAASGSTEAASSSSKHSNCRRQLAQAPV